MSSSANLTGKLGLLRLSAGGTLLFELTSMGAVTAVSAASAVVSRGRGIPLNLSVEIPVMLFVLQRSFNDTPNLRESTLLFGGFIVPDERYLEQVGLF